MPLPVSPVVLAAERLVGLPFDSWRAARVFAGGAAAVLAGPAATVNCAVDVPAVAVPADAFEADAAELVDEPV